MNLFAFAMPGMQELLIVAAIALLLFGKRLPAVMGSLGQGISEFKKGVSGLIDGPDELPANHRPELGNDCHCSNCDPQQNHGKG